MENSKYINLRTSCTEALADDNLEKCLQILAENLGEGQNFTDFNNLKARLISLTREWNGGRISFTEYMQHRNQIRFALLEFVGKTLQPEDISTFMSGINDRILIVACKNSPTNWERLFPDDRYSHVLIITRGDDVPMDFKNPDIIIFDNLNCGSLLGPRNEMKRLAEEMPRAHILYVGDANSNPFMTTKVMDEQAIFARTANANSHLSIHGRLNELLEFRKNYGPPLSTVILENMKDKLPLKIFISYSHNDEDWKRELDMHLAAMKRQGLIEVWQDRQIAPGTDWDEEIKHRLEGSHLILFMLSVGFMNSEYIWKNEVPIAMDLHHTVKAKVVPIFTKETDTKGMPFEKLQGLPRDAKFLASQPNRDQILATVAKELRELVENWGK